MHLPPPAGHLPLPSSLPPLPSSSSLPPPGLEERGGGDFAESLARLILGADPAIAGVGPAGPDCSRGLPPMLLHPQLPSTGGPLGPQLPPPGGPLGPHHLSLLSYQQQQQHLRRATPPMQQVSAASSDRHGGCLWEAFCSFIYRHRDTLSLL